MTYRCGVCEQYVQTDKDHNCAGPHLEAAVVRVKPNKPRPGRDAIREPIGAAA